jgi:tetratricopeptide (TPR) repeat protein
MCALSLLPQAVLCEERSPDLLVPMRARLELNRELAGRAETGSLRKAELLLLSGDPERAWEILENTTPEGAAYHALRAKAAFVLHDFTSARESLEELHGRSPDGYEIQRLQIKWLLTCDDLEGLDRYCELIMSGDPSSSPALLGRGRLKLLTLDRDSARLWFERALRRASVQTDSVRALEGIADVLYEEQKFDSSLVYLKRALPLEAADDRLLESVALTLIRLGRVGEAIEAADLAVEIDPFNERAQYTLGNGYSRLNYTELEAAYPEAFPGPAEELLLAEMDSTLAAGDREHALDRLLEMVRTHPELTDVHVRLGSLAFEDGDFDAALSHFRAGLRACPGNGRARNGISKALEAKKLGIDVHREDYEKSFADTCWPDVPGIEDFVLNWRYLSDRHKKRVALSIEPWRQFIPVLIESGSNYYIKPLYQRLSDCPGLETLKDQRIDYDSRLWDDVRGCGGYSTVTGIEDVERTVLNRYNTVLHELTHQVHYVLTTEENRAVQDLYRRAKERDKDGEDVFLSRYQGSSVWEYLAEGANSLMTPRRDDYDTKEIVRERLLEMDPELADLVGELMSVTDMEPYYAVGYANSGYDKLEKNRVEEAVRQFRKALERDADSPQGRAGLIYALSIRGDHEAACDSAERGLESNPEDAEILLQASRAFYHREGDIRARIERIKTGSQRIEERDRYLIDLELANAYLAAGDIVKATAAFDRVLDYQEDNHEALWGMGIAKALAGDMDSARAHFDRAVLRRSGITDLRTDYALVLLDAGDLEGAGAQLNEARLLDPENAQVAMIGGRIEFLNGDLGEAIVKLERALGYAPHLDLARVFFAEAVLESGEPRRAWNELEPVIDRIENGLPPEYFYNENRFTFEVIHELPAYERRAAFRVASEISSELKNPVDAERFAGLAEEALRNAK